MAIDATTWTVGAFLLLAGCGGDIDGKVEASGQQPEAIIQCHTPGAGAASVSFDYMETPPFLPYGVVSAVEQTGSIDALHDRIADASTADGKLSLTFKVRGQGIVLMSVPQSTGDISFLSMRSVDPFGNHCDSWSGTYDVTVNGGAWAVAINAVCKSNKLITVNGCWHN